MYLDIILLVLSPRIDAYDFTSCDISCDNSYVPLSSSNNKKEKEKKSQKKRNIKSKK